MSAWQQASLLIGVGIVAGALNVIAGGGSFLTLPVLIFLGLPASLANGTNRVGIVLQNVVAVERFDHHGVLDRRSALWAALPATIGSVFGTWAALRISDDAFERLLAILMVVFALLSLWPPKRSASAARNGSRLALGCGFFVVGVYAGFVQAGVGFLILAVTSFAGLDLVRGNAVKVLSILAASILSLAMFAWRGQVDWLLGLALAIGMMIGGALGARATLRGGHRFVRLVVTVTVIAFAIKLWLDSTSASG